MKYLFLLFSLYAVQFHAQDRFDSKIEAAGKWDNSKVILRWAPNNHIAWKQSLTQSYTIQRSTYAKDSTETIKGPFETIAKDIKCMTLEQMKTKLGKDSEFGAIAAQAIYGAEIKMGNSDLSDFKNTKSEQENRFSFALFAAENDGEVAKVIGLRFDDIEMNKGYQYIYKIFLNTTDPTIKIDTAYVLVSTMKTETEIFLPDLNMENMENAVRISWDQNGFEEIYSGYFLEKRKLGSENWSRLNKRAMVRLINRENPSSLFYFTDSLAINYQKYEYRLVGLSTFAENQYSPKHFIGYGRDLTPPSPPVNLTIEATEKYDILLKWKKPTIEADFKGFMIQKAFSAEGPFSSIVDEPLSKNTTEYVDNQYNPLVQTYYRIAAIDTANNASMSFSIYAYFVDSIAPSKPQTPKGEISEIGVTKLIWNLGSEKDIKGYRVFKANFKTDEFINITPDPITDTVYFDTISLKTTTKSVYYKIVAVDFHFNHSVQSEMLQLKRPDIMPPSCPVFNSIITSDTVVTLSWFNSPSNDVSKTVVLRQEKDKKPEILKTFDGNSMDTFEDKTIIIGKTYLYFLYVIDESGLISDTSKPVDALIYNNKGKSPAQNLTLLRSDNKRDVNLTWEYSISQKYYFVVYRSFNDGAMQAVGNVESKERKFSDKNTIGNGKYNYKVVVYYEDGTQSNNNLESSIVLN